MSFFRWLRGDRTPTPKRVITIDPHELEKVSIVGEASYQKELGTLVPGPKTEDSVSVWKLATLTPEPSNPVDPDAVVVTIDGLTVGYLDRKQAPLFHQMMEEAGRTGEELSEVAAEIRGGWRRDGISQRLVSRFTFHLRSLRDSQRSEGERSHETSLSCLREKAV